MTGEDTPVMPSKPAPSKLGAVSCSPRTQQGRAAARRHRSLKNLTLRKAARFTFAALLSAAAATGVYKMHTTGVFIALIADARDVGRHILVSSGLTVGEIVVSGRRNTPHADIAGALGVVKGDLLFDVEPQVARERVEALGWVRSASVRRQFPETVYVQIVERRPFALWQRGGRAALIDREGEVISVRDLEGYDRLPVIVGEDAPDHVGALVSVLARQPTLFGKIEAATRVSSRRWDVRLAGGLEVRLPEQGVAEAWDLLAFLVRDHGLLKRDVVAVDLRVADRLAVKLGPASAAIRRSEGRDT